MSSTSTLLRLNTDWFIIFIECHYYVPPSLLTLLDGRQVQNPSTDHHYQTTQRFLAFPPLWLTSTNHNVNKNSPYYSHALKYNHNPPILTPVIQPPQLLERYNAQYRFLPMFQYLSGSPTQHLSLMFKHLLFRNLKHMLIPQEHPIKPQSIAARTRVSNPPEYTKYGD